MFVLTILKKKKKTNNAMKIPGLSFSWKRAIGVSKLKRDFAKATGIPTTRNGLERKIGGAIINAVFGKKKNET